LSIFISEYHTSCSRIIFQFNRSITIQFDPSLKWPSPTLVRGLFSFGNNWMNLRTVTRGCSPLTFFRITIWQTHFCITISVNMKIRVTSKNTLHGSWEKSKKQKC
jgi:hypothetical protein